jgi:hypothetical protein
VEPGLQPGESPVDRYRRELRDLMVAGIDFRRIPTSPPPTRNPDIRHDLILVAEHYSDGHLRDRALTEGEVKAAVHAEIADDICACVEAGRWDQLQPTAWAVRVAFAWWYEMNRLERAVQRLWGLRPPRPAGRSLHYWSRLNNQST